MCRMAAENGFIRPTDDASSARVETGHHHAAAQNFDDLKFSPPSIAELCCGEARPVPDGYVLVIM